MKTQQVKKEAVSGFRWLALTSVTQRLLGFAATVVLARLLDPHDFGLYAMAFIVIDAFSLIQNLGIDNALVQRKEEDQLASDTAFWLILAMGFGIFAVIQLVAPFFGRWMENPEVTPILQCLAAIFLISCLCRVPSALLSKRRQFAKRAAGQISAEVVYTILALTLALNGWKVWSLVVAYLVKVTVQNAIAGYFSGWRPTFGFDKEIARKLLGFGKFLVANDILWFFRRTVGDLFVGKLLGAASLGIYSIALGVAGFLNEYLFGKMGQVTFPILAKVQDDPEHMTELYLKFLKYVAIVALPVGVGLFLVAEPFVRVVYGAKWLPVVQPLQILSLAAMMGALNQPAHSVFHATGSTRISFNRSLVIIVSFLVVVVPLTSRWGAVGTATSVLISTTLGFLATFWGLHRVIELRFRSVYKSLSVPLGGAAILIVTEVALAHLISSAGAEALKPFWYLALMVGCGAAAYLAYITAVERAFWPNVRSFLQ